MSRKRSEERIECFGSKLSITEASVKFGIDAGTLRSRIRTGQTLEEAVQKPYKKRKFVPRVRFEDRVGKKYGKLEVVAIFRDKRWGGNHLFARCVCECGRPITVRMSNLVRGGTTSCGCSHKDNHNGLSAHPLYKRWANMIERCYNAEDKDFNKYGGRGITVSEEWHNPEKYIEDVIALGIMKDSGLTIDRIDNNGPYSMENCRSATQIVQHNNKRNNVYYDIGGKKQTLNAWARQMGVPISRVKHRVRSGWSILDALNVPAWGRRKEC